MFLIFVTYSIHFNLNYDYKFVKLLDSPVLISNILQGSIFLFS